MLSAQTELCSSTPNQSYVFAHLNLCVAGLYEDVPVPESSRGQSLCDILQTALFSGSCIFIIILNLFCCVLHDRVRDIFRLQIVKQAPSVSLWIRFVLSRSFVNGSAVFFLIFVIHRVAVCVGVTHLSLLLKFLSFPFYYSYTIMTQNFHKICGVHHYLLQLHKSSCFHAALTAKPIPPIKGRAHLLFSFQSLHQRSFGTKCSSQGETESGHRREISCIPTCTFIFSESSPSVWTICNYQHLYS